jgi:hypothetical protein
MGTPALKVLNPRGEYIAACVHVEDAAALLALNGEGSKIKLHGRIVYTDGIDGHASDSYDAVGRIINNKLHAWRVADDAARRQ